MFGRSFENLSGKNKLRESNNKSVRFRIDKMKSGMYVAKHHAAFLLSAFGKMFLCFNASKSRTESWNQGICCLFPCLRGSFSEDFCGFLQFVLSIVSE